MRTWRPEQGLKPSIAAPERHFSQRGLDIKDRRGAKCEDLEQALRLSEANMNGPKIAWAQQAFPSGMFRIRVTALLTSLLFSANFLVHGQPGADPHRVDVVVIDAGHGGKDPGNLGTGRFKTTEKDVVLSVGRQLGKYIKESFPDVKVIYTREDDRFIELRERCEIANRNKADVFISIHCNANESHAPFGAETYVMGLHKTEANMRVAQKENAAIVLEEGHSLKYDGYDPNDPESMIALSLRQNTYLDHSLFLSSLVQKQFKERVGRTDRGVKQAGFLVISYTTMPAILVELGFLTNAKEEDYLQSAEGQEYLASGLFRAFKEYKLQMEGVSANAPVGDTARTPTPSGNALLAASSPDIRFKVQIVTSSKPVALKAKNFNGIEGVQEYQGNGTYKYVVGNEPTLDACRSVQRICQGKGYPGCFIVAFRGGERIDLQEAVKLAGNTGPVP
jgi:N-acetylmuramoyl-L-alanine amidase